MATVLLGESGREVTSVMDAARIRAVVFDMDGTLVDSLGVAPEAYVRTVRDLGGREIGIRDVVTAWHIGPAPIMLRHFLDRATTPDDLELFFRHLASAVVGIRPFPGVGDLLGSLRSRGMALGVYTSAMRRVAEVTLAEAGVGAFFSTFVGGDDVSRPKPSGEGVLAACRALRAGPGETAYVGDSAGDLASACDAGALAVHAMWATSARDIPGDHLRAGRPGEVLRLVEGTGKV